MAGLGRLLSVKFVRKLSWIRFLFNLRLRPKLDFMPSCEAQEDHGGCYKMLLILGDGDGDDDVERSFLKNFKN